MTFKNFFSFKITHKNKSLKYPIIILVVLQLTIFILLLTTSNFFEYDIDNYRYIYSSLLQIIGSMFAFIASSTLVAYQFLASFSPMSVSYYPKNLFVSFLIVTLIVIGFDVFAINMLQFKMSSHLRCIHDFIITLNIYPLVLTFQYVLFVIRSITPHNQLENLIEMAKRAKNNEDRLNVIYSLEEICLSAIRNGQGGYIRSCQDKFQNIIDIYSTSHIELNKNSIQHPDNPLRIIPDVIERITYSMVDNNMQNLVHFNGHILRLLSNARYDGKRIVGVEIASAINNIGIYCIEKRKITDINNFIANTVFCLEKTNSASTIFWGCEMLINSCQSHIESYSHEILEVIEDIFECVIHAIQNNNVPKKDSTSMIEFLLSQEWLENHYKEHEIKKILISIDKLNSIRNDLYQHL